MKATTTNSAAPVSNYAEIETAQVSEKRPTLEEGDYLVAIDAIKDVTGFTGRFFIPEFTVLEASGSKASPVGTRASNLIKQNPKFPKLFWNNILSFVAALLGEDPTDIKGPMVDNLVSKANPAKGSKVRVQVRRKDGAADGFPVHSYFPA